MSLPAPLPAIEPNWLAYYQAVADRPPRPTLLQALANFDRESGPTQPQLAVDLGCGDGRDTVELLHRGWRVLAIDGEVQALERLLARPISSALLQTQRMRFEDLTLPPQVDLINASFCLPFCQPARFPQLWNEIVSALRVGGRFCGQLLGERDSWAVYPNRTHHTLQQVLELLIPFTIEFFEVEEHLGATALKEEKYWHIFHIVASKRG